MTKSKILGLSWSMFSSFRLGLCVKINTSCLGKCATFPDVHIPLFGLITMQKPKCIED